MGKICHTLEHLSMIDPQIILACYVVANEPKKKLTNGV